MDAEPEGRTPGVSRRGFLGLGVLALAGAAGGGGMARYALGNLNRVRRFPEEDLTALREGERPALLRAHPALATGVPWMPLASHPTPVEELPLPEGATARALLVKRDDLGSSLYAGNKLRKLEHLLAEATLAECTTLVTLGGLGTNHGLATALHGRRLGFRVELSLYDQPMTEHAHRNLERLRASGAAIHLSDGEVGALMEARRIVAATTDRGEAPYFINFGGTSRLGTVGYVGAALELAEQVAAGETVRPDVAVVAVGTCGTAAGLVAGFGIAGLSTRVRGVRVTGVIPANRHVIRYCAKDAAEWLRSLDPSVADPGSALDDFHVDTRYRGPAYGVPTEEALAAVEWARPRLELETTYTGKAFAACLDYCRSPEASGRTVLFWNTFSWI